MEIRRWHYCIVFNCVLLQYVEAKTISLNEVIAAESQQKEAFGTIIPSKLTDNTSKRNSLIKRQSSTSRVKNFLESKLFQDTIVGGKSKSPLKYKKAFQIKTPLKPKKLKLLQKSRYKRKNLSAKREINGNETLKQKYIPLLKSLSMLFDNLLSTDASDEVKTKKFKRNRFYSEETFEVSHNSHKFDARSTKSKSQEKTITSSQSLSAEISFTTENLTINEVAATTTNNTSTRDFSTFRQNKDIPVLLPRNTFSAGRNNNGISERSGSTLHRNIEGVITGHHGNHEHSTGNGENESGAEDDEKNTNNATRDSARSFKFSGAHGNRNNTGVLSRNNSFKNETTNDSIPENQLETRRDKAKSTKVLQESVRRLRGFTSEDVNQNTESVQPKYIHEESFFNVTHDNTGDKRFTGRGSPITTEDQKICKRNETMILFEDSLNSTSQSITSQKKSPVVMIFDGYSITRHKNGDNKFAEKSIRIHS